MARSTRGRATDYNDEIIAEFRANGGRVGGVWAGTPLILIHHIGAKSGTERVTPLGYSTRQHDGGYVIIASNGGSPTHPSWYHNLRANPRITVEVGGETFAAVAEELDDRSRAELWPDLVDEFPSLREFESKTARTIPVILLTRQDS